MIHQNSLWAYAANSKTLGQRARSIYAWIKEHGEATDREVMKALGFSEPNSVRPRITELVKNGLLIEVGAQKDPTTGVIVRKVRVA